MGSQPIVVDPSQVQSITVDPSEVQASAPDAITQALTYKPDQPWIKGVLQGMGKGAMSTGVGALDIIRKAQGQPEWLTPEQRQGYTVPSGPGQGTGKFMEQTGEFAIPTGVAGEVMKAAPLAARLGAQSAIGGLLSAAQSGGDPKAIMLGTALGGGGELLGAGARGVTQLAKAPLASTIGNFRDAFAAIPTQLRWVTDAMPTLAKYGIGPERSVPEMKAAVDNQLAQLGQQYAAHEAAGIGDKTLPAQQMLDELDKVRARYTTSRGNIPSAAKDIVKTIDDQIADVKADTDAAGNIKFKDLRTLRDAANRRTNWLNPDEDVYSSFGNVYRGGMDQIEPGMAELNRDYQRLSQLSGIADKNIGYGRGVLPSRLEQIVGKAARPAVGTMLGSQAGAGAAHLLGLPPMLGELVGGAVGAVAYPKITGPVFDALKNAADSGQLAKLSGAAQFALRAAIRLNDKTAILRILGSTPQAMVSSAVAQPATP
jgi:hypothetical protein